MKWGEREPLDTGALLCCLLAAGIVVWSALDAWRIDPPPPPRSGDTLTLAIAGVRREPHSLPAAAVVRAVGRDPFRPDRRPAAQRYRLPGEPPPPQPPNVSGWTLVGTASHADGSGIAAISLGGESRVYHVGDSVGEMLLIRVAPGSAVLQWRDTTITLGASATSGGTP